MISGLIDMTFFKECHYQAFKLRDIKDKLVVTH